ncbi:hypothetical protein HHI36_003773 [Cryptolaemus montrouzieri]|uniref:Uncharacterized protein n=1 Tax=Cryptolaemus montrouzieri TaxID=559131 RepID=A0ABD2NQA2_9CUCU
MDSLINQAHSSLHLTERERNESEKSKSEILTLLDEQHSKCAQLSLQLQESELKYSKLLIDFKTLEIQKEESETALKLKADMGAQNELSKLREDLQCHLQTIGLLVAEKTELSSILSETQSALKNESSHHIDLQNKMKEMKSYYSNLEHELEVLKSEKINFNSIQKNRKMYYLKCGKIIII